jgi:hypothetical protein
MFIKHGELAGASVKLPKKRKSMVLMMTLLRPRHSAHLPFMTSMLTHLWWPRQVFLFNDLVVRAKVVKANEKYVFEEYAGYVNSFPSSSQSKFF